MTSIDDFRGFYPGSKQPLPPLDTPAVQPKATKPDTPWDARPVTKIHGGQELEFFTIGALAKALQKSPGSIRNYIGQGHLPQASYRLPEKNGRAGRRLYTRGQIEVVVKLATHHGFIDTPTIQWADHPDFASEVRQAWGALPPL